MNKLLSNIGDPDASDISEILEYEEKLKELRNMLITDIVRRENFILDVSDVIAREKKEFFSFEDMNHVKNK